MASPNSCMTRAGTAILVVALALVACGGSAAGWTERGDALLRDNDLVEAEAAYNRAIDLDPHYAPALYGKGWALYASGFEALRPASRQLFQRSIEYQPEYFGGYRGKAVLLLEDGKVLAAETLLRTAFAKNSESSAVLSSLGQLYLRADRLEEAEELFQRALELSPDRGELRRYLAEVALARGDVEQALVEIEKGRASAGGKRGMMVIDEGEERVLLETVRLLLEDPEGEQPEAAEQRRLKDAEQALERAAGLLEQAGGPGMSKAPLEQRRRYHELLSQRVRQRVKP